MSRTVFPGKYGGTVRVPSSKSLLHRYLIMAALTKEKCMIENCSFSDDVRATVEALECFGVNCVIDGDRITVCGEKMHAPEETVWCGESGSTLRFLIPLAALFDREIRFSGKPSLMARPLGEYEKLFATYHLENDVLTVGGFKSNRDIHINGGISSQFFTGLMMAMPLMDYDTVIHIEGKLESQPYVIMTARCLRKYGISVEIDSTQIFIKGNQQYCRKDVTVEGDFSQASYWLALGCINSPVEVIDLSEDSLQGDKRIVDIIARAAGKISKTGSGYQSDPAALNGLQVDCRDNPDLVMTLVVLAMFSRQKWVLENVGRLRYKESDRLAAIREVFSQLGAIIETEEETITVSGRKALRGPVTVNCHNDHRMVMSAAICATSLEYPVTITDDENVNKSYPGFFETLEGIRI